MAYKTTKTRTRADNGKGSFRKLKSGKYEYRISYKDFFLKTITKYSDSVIGKIYSQLKTAFRIAYHKGIINNNLMQSPELRQPK